MIKIIDKFDLLNTAYDAALKISVESSGMKRGFSQLLNRENYLVISLYMNNCCIL